MILEKKEFKDFIWTWSFSLLCFILLDFTPILCLCFIQVWGMILFLVSLFNILLDRARSSHAFYHILLQYQSGSGAGGSAVVAQYYRNIDKYHPGTFLRNLEHLHWVSVVNTLLQEDSSHVEDFFVSFLEILPVTHYSFIFSRPNHYMSSASSTNWYKSSFEDKCQTSACVFVWGKMALWLYCPLCSHGHGTITATLLFIDHHYFSSRNLPLGTAERHPFTTCPI